MPHFEIISSSVRADRHSHRVALFFEKLIQTNQIGTAGILDLNEFQFPIFEERLKFQKDPSPQVLAFADRVKSSDGIIIVTPEYNGSFPASLKNVIDLLYIEWYRKPVGIATVSDGDFGGTQVIIALQSVLWKMKAWTAPTMFPVPNVVKLFDEEGNETMPDKTNKRALAFIKEIVWCIEANRKMASESL
ncbi:MAG: NAD(P)H-dependent oxidoreductase [Cytophagales bacterium]|nr:NAD(P)H-dependent oxidoreductase [Cytophagales bacterium]